MQLPRPKHLISIQNEREVYKKFNRMSWSLVSGNVLDFLFASENSIFIIMLRHLSVIEHHEGFLHLKRAQMTDCKRINLQRILVLVNPADCLIGLRSVGFKPDACLLVLCVCVHLCPVADC